MLKVHQEFREFKVFKGLQVHRVFKVLLVALDQLVLLDRLVDF